MSCSLPLSRTDRVERSTPVPLSSGSVERRSGSMAITVHSASADGQARGASCSEEAVRAFPFREY